MTIRPEQPSLHRRRGKYRFEIWGNRAVFNTVMAAGHAQQGAGAQKSNQVPNGGVEALEGVESRDILHVHFADLVRFALQNGEREYQVERARNPTWWDHGHTSIGRCPANSDPARARVDFGADDLSPRETLPN